MKGAKKKGLLKCTKVVMSQQKIQRPTFRQLEHSAPTQVPELNKLRQYRGERNATVTPPVTEFAYPDF